MRLRYCIISVCLTLVQQGMLFPQEQRPGTNTAIISLFFKPLTPHMAKQLAKKDLQELCGEDSTKELSDECLVKNPETSVGVSSMSKQNPYEASLGEVDPRHLKETASKATTSTDVPFLQGIYVSYQGTVATSDYNGQVTFSNHQTKPTLTVVVTDSLTPVIIFSNTVQHMKVREGHEAIFYEVTRERDQKLKKFVWNIRVIPTPANGRIPDDALLISAKPSQIVIPEGKTITEQDVNLLLPTIYLRTTITATDNALQFMKVAKFYAPVEKTTSYASDRYATMISR